jgi:hypothetical protein
LKHEVFREPIHIPVDGLIEGLCRDVVTFREVRIQHDAVTPNGMNSLENILCSKGWF